MIEGIAAMAIVFLLLAMVVQTAFLVVARNAAESAVGATARRAARPAADLAAAEANLREVIGATVPGAQDVLVRTERTESTAEVMAEFTWDPPGPVLRSLRIRVRASQPVIQPP